jgi:hypothetical protein
MSFSMLSVIIQKIIISKYFVVSFVVLAKFKSGFPSNDMRFRGNYREHLRYHTVQLEMGVPKNGKLGPHQK